jgi:hypothetical protein
MTAKTRASAPRWCSTSRAGGSSGLRISATPSILFDDRDLPVRVDAAAIEWEVADNTYTLNRATLELDVIGRVYRC